jgi:hypothetical protein
MQKLVKVVVALLAISLLIGAPALAGVSETVLLVGL